MNIPDMSRGVTGYVDVVLRLLLVGALGVAGCSDDSSPQTTASPLSQQTLPNANPARPQVSLTSGSACLPDSTTTTVSADGLVFTTTFSSFVTALDSSKSSNVGDCALSLSIPSSRSYAVASYELSGYALLGDGVAGEHATAWSFAGKQDAQSTAENRLAMVGPLDQNYHFAREVPADQQVWSQCGRADVLTIDSSMALRNASQPRTGYMSMSAGDGAAMLVVRLAERACDVVSPTTTPGDDQSQLVRVSQVTVQPTGILRTDPFTVSWQTPAANVGAVYRVQLRTPVADGDALFWESPEIDGNAVRYDGPPLPSAGAYQVLVVARRGTEERSSDRMTLVVRDTVGATIGKPTAVRVQPTPIQRSEPFLVSWSASANASGSTLYRAEIRTPRSDGARLVAQSSESEATVAAFPALSLPGAGRYEVVVVARDPSGTAASDALTIDAVDGQVTAPQKSPLIGRYVARSQSYIGSADGSGSLTAVRELYLAELAEVNGGIELRTRLCAQETSWAGFTLDMVTPEAFSEIRRKVTVDGNSWSTDDQPVSIGYLRDGVPECVGKAGRTVPKRAEQRWIRGTSCRCPTTAATPPTLDDCRVTDPDGDGQPGLAYNLTGSLARLDWTAHFVSVVRSHPVRGVIEPNGRHSSQLRFDESDLQLTCQPASVCGVTTIADSMLPCVSSANRMEFLPLPSPPNGQASWTCATLRGSSGRLFPRPIPSVRSCQRDKLTGM